MTLVENERALVLSKAARYLVVSDLHIGLEESLSRKGVHIPSQTSRMAHHLVELGKSTRCDSLVLLGDVKDEFVGVSPWGLHSITQFFETVTSFFPEVLLIPGNHDGGIEHHLPGGVKLATSHGVIIQSQSEQEDEGNVALLHGHADPSPVVSRARTFIMGHRHFVFRVGRNPQPLWIRGRFGQDLEKYLIVVPPFNHLLPGAAGFRRSSNAGYSKSYVSKVVDSAMDTLDALLLDGTNLGTLKSLQGSLGMVDS